MVNYTSTLKAHVYKRRDTFINSVNNEFCYWDTHGVNLIEVMVATAIG